MREIISTEFDKFWFKIKTTIENAIANELAPIKKEIADFQESLSFISCKYEKLSKKVEALECDFKSFKVTQTDVNDLKTNVHKLEVDNNSREQWSRRSNVEIYGIPERKSENLVVLLKDIAQRINFPLNTDCDVDFITRVAPRENNLKKPKPIVVRFLAHYKKTIS